LRCKRDIARYWKPLVYHWQYWKLHHMGQVSTGSYECYGVIGGYIHSLQFLPLKRRQRGPFQGNHDWKPIPGPAELRPFVGTGRSGERISRTSNWSSLDSRKILNYNSHIRIDNAPTERPYHAWHKGWEKQLYLEIWSRLKWCFWDLNLLHRKTSKSQHRFTISVDLCPWYRQKENVALMVFWAPSNIAVAFSAGTVRREGLVHCFASTTWSSDRFWLLSAQ